MTGFGQVVAAPVEQLELLRDDPRFCELTAAVATDQGVLQLLRRDFATLTERRRAR